MQVRRNSLQWFKACPSCPASLRSMRTSNSGSLRTCRWGGISYSDFKPVPVAQQAWGQIKPPILVSWGHKTFWIMGWWSRIWYLRFGIRKNLVPNPGSGYRVKRHRISDTGTGSAIHKQTYGKPWFFILKVCIKAETVPLCLYSFFKEAMQLWFGKSLATDLEVKTRFGHLVEDAFRYRRTVKKP